MTIRYNVEPDREALAEVISLFEFLGGNTRDALRVAINKAGPKVKTAAGKEIRSQVRLKTAYVNKRIKFFRATRANLSAKISTPSRGLLLSKFSLDKSIADHEGRWPGPVPEVPDQGIRIKIKPKGRFIQFDGHSDIMGRTRYIKLQNGRLAIAGILSDSARASAIKAEKGTGSRGGRVKVFYGPSLSQVFTKVKNEVPAGEELTAQMADAIRFLLAKKAAKE